MTHLEGGSGKEVYNQFHLECSKKIASFVEKQKGNPPSHQFDRIVSGVILLLPWPADPIVLNITELRYLLIFIPR